MARAQSVLKTLDRLIGSGELKSTVDQFADSLRASPNSFYKRELQNNGRESAEKLLDDVIRRRNLREFSAAIEPIAVGMRDIVSSAEETDTYSSVVNGDSASSFSPVFFDSDTVSVVVVYGLPQHKGCGCTQPDEEEVFGQCGTLPLKALLLIESSGGNHKLYLVFPMRDDLVGVVERGFASVSIRRDGGVDGIDLVSHMTTDSLLQYKLGIVFADQALRVSSSSGGSLDYRLGFPGAERYLLEHLPRLGPYYNGLEFLDTKSAIMRWKMN